MQKARRSFAATIGAMLLALVCLPAPTVVADARVPIGGGTPIIVNGNTMCTLTTIGTDATDELIGFTSAHCGGPGAEVMAEAAQNKGPLGTMVAGNDSLDYAVIKFDPTKVTPVATFNGFLISGVSLDPRSSQVACKQGRTTGNSCGVIWGPGQNPGTILAQVCGGPGDSAAPVTVNNLLIGMIHGAYSDSLPSCVTKYIPLHTPAVIMSFKAVLADVKAKDRPGMGFVPTPA